MSATANGYANGAHAEVSPLAPRFGIQELPQAEDAEESVIGGILFKGNCYRQVADFLEAGDFYHTALNAIYEAMMELYRDGRPIDIITVAEQMRANGTIGKLRAYNGEAYLAELANKVATVENIEHHAKMVCDKAASRRFIEEASALVTKGYSVRADQLSEGLGRLQVISQGARHWPVPESLTGGLLPVPQLDPLLVPASLRDWLCDVVERAQCPLEYPAVGALVGAASLLGRQLAIRPRSQDNWTEFPNLWGMIIGPPGVLKTPALKEALYPLYRLQGDAWREHKEQVAAQEMKEPVRKAEERQIKRDIDMAVSAKLPTTELEEELRKLQPKKLSPKRYVTSDATIEKLVTLIEENPNGLLVHRDELRGLLLGA